MLRPRGWYPDLIACPPASSSENVTLKTEELRVALSERQQAEAEAAALRTLLSDLKKELARAQAAANAAGKAGPQGASNAVRNAAVAEPPAVQRQRAELAQALREEVVASAELLKRAEELLAEAARGALAPPPNSPAAMMAQKQQQALMAAQGQERAALAEVSELRLQLEKVEGQLKGQEAGLSEEWSKAFSGADEELRSRVEQIQVMRQVQCRCTRRGRY